MPTGLYFIPIQDGHSCNLVADKPGKGSVLLLLSRFHFLLGCKALLSIFGLIV